MSLFLFPPYHHPPPPRPRIRPTQVGLTLARHRLAYRGKYGRNGESDTDIHYLGGKRYLKSKHFLGIFASNGTRVLSLSPKKVQVGHGHEIPFHSDAELSGFSVERRYRAGLLIDIDDTDILPREYLLYMYLCA